MIDDKIREMINLEIDGALLPADQDRLRERIKADSEVSALYEEHLRLSKMLAAKQEVDAPELLKEKVLSEIRARHEAANRTDCNSQSSSTIRQFLAGFSNWRSAYVFAGGAAVGALLLIAFSGIQHSKSTWNDTDARGTMFLRGDLPSGGNSQKSELSVAGLSIEMRTTEFGEQVFLELTGRGSSAVDIQVRFVESELAVAGIYCGDSFRSPLALSPGTVSFELPGPNHIVMAFNRPIQGQYQIEVRANSNGQEKTASLGTK